jgi:hypothetical protein
MKLEDLKKSLAAVSVPSALVLVMGAMILYLIGRWSQSIDTAWAAHRAAVDQALEAGKDYRVWRDSVQAQQLAAEARAAGLDSAVRRQTEALEEMKGQIARDSAASATSSIAELLEGLRLRPIGREMYGTDSAGVRFLEGLRLQALKAPLVPRLEAVRDSLQLQVEAVRQALGFASQRADSAEARAIELEGLLEEGQKLGQCRIIGFIPCPSRTVVFIGGVVIGASVTAVAASRQSSR